MFIGLKVKQSAHPLDLSIVLFVCQINEKYFRNKLYGLSAVRKDYDTEIKRITLRRFYCRNY